MYYRIYKHFYYIYIREIMDFIHWIKVISSQGVVFHTKKVFPLVGIHTLLSIKYPVSLVFNVKLLTIFYILHKELFCNNDGKYNDSIQTFNDFTKENMENWRITQNSVDPITSTFVDIDLTIKHVGNTNCIVFWVFKINHQFCFVERT